jgi:metal-sulfur cluster biosynthetic enzyme
MSQEHRVPGSVGRPSMPSVEEIRDAVKMVEDPEIGISIVELGLVYGIENVDGDVSVTMTLTSPFCPIGPLLISQIQTVVEEMPGIKSCNVELVWSPPWDPKTMASDDAKDMLGIW